MSTKIVNGDGTKESPWQLKTPPGTAEYEAYRARLKDDPLGRENYEFAKAERFILKEDRIFLKLASAPHGGRR